MKFVNNLTKSILLFNAIALSFIIPNPASAKDFKIGGVKQQFQTYSLCYTFLPNTEKHMIVIPLVNQSQAIFAWVNIDGKDIRLRQVMSKDINSRRSIAKYQANNISVTVDYKVIKKARVHPDVSKTADRVSIDYQGHRKNINTYGGCI
jgi:hypothetical protein